MIEQRPNTDRKLNVLLVVPWDQESGGVAAVVGYLARHLETEGHGVLFLHPGASEVVRHKKTKWGFPAVELRLRAPFNPNYPVRSVVAFLVTFPFTLFQLVRLLRENDIRVVNIHFPGEHFVYFAFCRWLLPVRLVISIHGMDAIRWDTPSKPPSRALGLVFRAADLIVAPSWRFLRRCNDMLASFSARRLAIHNGTDLSELEMSEPNADDAQAPFILSVCSLDQWKGLDVLIRAIAILRDSGETTRLIVAGEGPLRVELERLIAELGLQQQVQLIGQQSRSSVARLLHQCTLFVLASRFEAFGIAVLEAMACGKAVVGTTVDGILEIIDDGENGILVEPEDPAALVAAIRRLLADAALRERLGEAARARVKNQFQRQRMGENYTHAFQEVLAHGA
jgi:glycosyltransferase involved in cell wall biosynthesis